MAAQIQPAEELFSFLGCTERSARIADATAIRTAITAISTKSRTVISQASLTANQSMPEGNKSGSNQKIWQEK